MKIIICALIACGMVALAGCSDSALSSQESSKTQIPSSISSGAPKQETKSESTFQSDTSKQEYSKIEDSENLKEPAASSKALIEVDIITYQSVLDDYSEKIKVATPTLIDEYNAEASSNSDGLEGLAEISNSKISKLAEITTEGVGEMAKIHLKSGSGKSSEYEEWAGKLQEVYMEESSKITQAYMDSAMQ